MNVPRDKYVHKFRETARRGEFMSLLFMHAASSSRAGADEEQSESANMLGSIIFAVKVVVNIL